MATRLPYYAGTDDIYSQLMRQYAQEQPYYSAGYGGSPSVMPAVMPAPSVMPMPGLSVRQTPGVMPESGVLYGDDAGGFSGGYDFGRAYLSPYLSNGMMPGVMPESGLLYGDDAGGFSGGYDPGLYVRQTPGVMPESGVLYGDGAGGFSGGPDVAPNPNATPGGFSFGGLIGGGSTPASTTTPGSVSTGLGGFSLSPEGVVTANNINVPAATALGFLTGMPLGLIANVVNQGAGGQAASQTQAMADTMGINAMGGFAATAGPGGTGGAAASAASAAAAAATAAGASPAAAAAAAQAAADAVVGGGTTADAAAAGAAASGTAGIASADGVGASGIGTGETGVSAAGEADAGGPGSGGGSDSGGGGGGGVSSGACVIATHAVASGAFTPNEKRQAVKWCVKNLHRTWWGEAIRRGYRYYGRKAIEAGKAKNHYQEFRDYVAFATGTRKTPKTALTFAWRNVQFFVTGIFVKD